ncbi:MAG: FkbM family methyltransferase [Reichenbachiella sp.]|uniref:FkbM family methyltransferase n=1 Tax=Reichenbachiella sp. TaxID=2184521 RepID=UPI003298BF7A
MNFLKKILSQFTGYWIYKQNHLPIGTDLKVDLIQKLEFSPRVIFDVGANIGQSALRFRSYFQNAEIFSFEPVDTAFEWLEKCLARDKNFKAYNFAFGEKNERVFIKLDDNPISPTNSLYNATLDQEIAQEIIVQKLDDFVNKLSIENIDLLKIDTEGWEIPVLNGAEQLIKTNKVKAIFAEVGFHSINKNNTEFNTLLEFLNRRKFRFYGMYDISNLRIKQNMHYGNALFIHDSLTR